MDTEMRAYLDAALEGLRQEIQTGTAETTLLGQEMRTGMAALRAETTELRQELRAETAGLRAETAELRQELRAETAELRQELRAETVGLRAETAGLRQDMMDQATALQREMRESADETRRHFDVVAESIRSDVRTVAEGVAANSEAIERLGTDLRAEMDSRFTASHAVVRVALAELRREIHERGVGR